MIKMGAILEEQARRLYLSRWLTRRVEEQAGRIVASDAIPELVDALEHRLDEPLDGQSMLSGLRFSPRYPGEAVEETTRAGRPRVVLACRAWTGSIPLGVVFTVLIGDRRPHVAVAPPNARADRSPSGGSDRGR